MKRKLAIALLTVISGMIVLTGCSQKSQTSISVSSEDINKVTVSLVSADKLDTALNLLLDVKNESPYDIVQNHIFLNHPIKTDNGYKDNKQKIETEESNFKVAVGETVRVSAVIPYDSAVNTETLCLDMVDSKIEGYFENGNDRLKYFKQEILFIDNGE